MAGFIPRASPPAAAWPLVGLAAMGMLAKTVAAGTLLLIDNAVAAEGRMLRVEAAQIMAAALPPAPSADDNAGPLYQRVFAALAIDSQVREPESPFWNSSLADAGSPQVAAILEQHAATLDLLRRAADKPGCRFDRDWSRPSIDMSMLEVQSVRQAARLLNLAARNAATDGNASQALADVIRIHRLGLHVASEPTLVSCLVGQAIDVTALQTLADVLPLLKGNHLPILDGELIHDVVETPITYYRAVLGEEAFGLAMLAGMADATRGTSTLAALRELSVDRTTYPFDEPLSLLYRCFLLPADISGYRNIHQRYQAVIVATSRPTPKSLSVLREETAEIEADLRSRRLGVFSVLMGPSLASVLECSLKGEAMHAVARVLVAATRARLVSGSLPTALVPDTLATLPRATTTSGSRS